MTANPTQTESFRALALQLTCQAVHFASSPSEARSIMTKAVESLGGKIAASLAFIGSDCRFVLLTEYCLTGFPMGEALGIWAQKACLEMDDPIYDRLAEIAQKFKIFLAGNAYEVDSNFPGLYFQNCFIFNPSGTMVLRYRRLNSMYTPTPHDVWDKYKPFAAGMVLTCEPVIYIREEGLGIRLENNLLITDKGAVNLMNNIPIEWEEIETIMNS
jgi:predicted amidohydrolase